MEIPSTEVTSSQLTFIIFKSLGLRGYIIHLVIYTFIFEPRLSNFQDLILVHSATLSDYQSLPCGPQDKEEVE